MRITVLLLFLNSLFCFFSCASIPMEQQPYAFLADNSKYVLLPPSGIEKPIDMIQHISASYGDREMFLSAWVKADETAVEMALFNDLGTGMGELNYRDGAINFSSSVFPKSLKPEYIVADFQLCFYEPLLLDRALKDCGLKFEIQNGIRTVFSGKELIIQIEKTESTIKFVNSLRGYSYSLEGDFL